MKYATYAVAKQKTEVCTGIGEVEVLSPTSLNFFQAFFRNLFVMTFFAFLKVSFSYWY